MLGTTPAESTIGSSAIRRRAVSTSRLSQPAWHVTRIARSPWRMESDGVRSAWQGHRHIAVLPDHVPLTRVTRARNSDVGLLLTRGIIAQLVPAPLPLQCVLCPVLARWTVHVGAHESVIDLQKIDLHTPLLAAEGFLILRIQIHRSKRGSITSIYGDIADLMGEFA